MCSPPLHFTANGQDSYWTYDALGNRLTQVQMVASQLTNLSYTYYQPSDEIEYVKQGDTIEWAFAYDQNGNMIERAKGATDNSGTPDFSTATETWLYSYDLQNRLVSVKKGMQGPASAQEVARYSYDHRGLRVLAVEGGQSAHYQYDQSGNLIYRDNGNERRDYIMALGQIWAEVRTTGTTSATYYHHTDHEGSTEVITDAHGNIVWQAGYEAFGKVVSENGSLDTQGLYTGKEYDEYTNLYYSSARWYDPTLGRFLSEDPARSGENWFAYVGNDPMSRIDPNGLDPLGVQLIEDAQKSAPLGETYAQQLAAVYISHETGSRALTDAIRKAINPKYVPNIIKWQLDNPEAAAKIASLTPAQKAYIDQPISYLALADTVLATAGAGAGGAMMVRDVAASEAASDPALVTVSRSRYPESAQHIEDAQAAGKPSTLTIDRAGAAARRQASLKGTKPVSGMDRDEYPPAMFSEGGTGADIRAIIPSDNRGSGGSIGAQVRDLPDGSQVKLRVTE